jgi:hypothetical protein
MKSLVGGIHRLITRRLYHDHLPNKERWLDKAEDHKDKTQGCYAPYYDLRTS